MTDFFSLMPPVTNRAHYSPSVGDSIHAIEDRAKHKPGKDGLRCIDMNFQLVEGVGVSMHWATPGKNGYTLVGLPGGGTRPMSKAELKKPADQWGLAGVLSWRRRNGDRPLTYAEACTEAVRRGVTICAELKSPGFGDVAVMRRMVESARAAGHPPWFMALFKMQNARAKCAATIAAGGEYAGIFGNFAKRKPSDWASWNPKPTRIWGPPKTRGWVGKPPTRTGPPRPPEDPEPPEEEDSVNLPDDLPKILRDAGLKVEEIEGWRGRGRPASTGGFAPVGVLCHHTATTRSTSDTNVIRLLVGGRSDLPGPLCHLGLSRDGTVYVIASGRANHAGKAKPSGTVAGGDGNRLYIGIEAFNDGRGEKWPAVQYDAYVRLAATLCEKVTHNSAQSVRGHKETSVTGKIDPTFDMVEFRRRVEAAMSPVHARKKVLPPPRVDAANRVEKAAKGVKRKRVARLLKDAARKLRGR